MGQRTDGLLAYGQNESLAYRHFCFLPYGQNYFLVSQCLLEVLPTAVLTISSLTGKLRKVSERFPKLDMLRAVMANPYKPNVCIVDIPTSYRSYGRADAALPAVKTTFCWAPSDAFLFECEYLRSLPQIA